MSDAMQPVDRGHGHDRGVLESEDGRSMGQLFASVTGDLSTLMRQEVALAKAELSQSGKNAGKGIGMLAGAGVAGLLVLVFLSLSLMYGLGQFMEYQWSALIVMVIWALIAAALANTGQKELKRIRGVPDTTDTLSKVPNALKGQEEKNR